MNNFFCQFIRVIWWKTLKILSQYLERFQIYCHSTEKFWQLTAYMHTHWPILYKCRQATARIFQLNDNKPETVQDIDLKFLSYVYCMSGLNWQKNLSHCLISGSVQSSILAWYRELCSVKLIMHTANILAVLSTAFGIVTCATVIWLHILQPKIAIDLKLYFSVSLNVICTVIDCNNHYHIAVAHLTQPMTVNWL